MDDRSPRIAIFNPRSSIRLKNAPFILREPQDERRSGKNYWSFSVHAEPVEAFLGVFQQNRSSILDPLLLTKREQDNPAHHHRRSGDLAPGHTLDPPRHERRQYQHKDRVAVDQRRDDRNLLHAVGLVREPEGG